MQTAVRGLGEAARSRVDMMIAPGMTHADTVQKLKRIINQVKASPEAMVAIQQQVHKNQALLACMSDEARFGSSDGQSCPEFVASHLAGVELARSPCRVCR